MVMWGFSSKLNSSNLLLLKVSLEKKHVCVLECLVPVTVLWGIRGRLTNLLRQFPYSQQV